MLNPECVIDSNLFQKISSDVEYRNIDELLKFKLESKQISYDDINDFKCFKDLLNEVKINRLTLGTNNKIKKEYIEFAKKCPKNDIYEIFRNIISRQGCFSDIPNNLDDNKAKIFSNTLIESKLDYITVAFFLNPKIIVSTHSEIEQKYEKCSSELLLLGIDSICPCTAKERLIYAESVKASSYIEDSKDIAKLVVPVEKRAADAKEILIKAKSDPIFTDIKVEIERILPLLETQLEVYIEAKEKARALMDSSSNGELVNTILGLNNMLTKHENLLSCIKHKLEAGNV